MKHKVLIIGSGGREHALAWKLKQSPKIVKIFIAPGNAGTAQVGVNVDIKATDFSGLMDFAKKEKIYLTVVGPDDPLALGIVDEFQKQGLRVWGPSKAAAQIEASKAFSKKLMRDNKIPTAEFQIFDDYEKASEYIEQHFTDSPPLRGGARGGWKNTSLSSPPPNLSPLTGEGSIAPIVIKASGLALGKGVTICQSLDEANKALKEAMVDKVFGEAGSEVIIEEFLQGQEFSAHAFCDGKTFQLFPSSQDHKPVFDKGKGPNTGGMGTIAPVPWVNQGLLNEIARMVVEPTMEGLKKLGADFTGLLYPGMMRTENGLKVLEFNARFGDPETQSYVRLLKTDLLDILDACVEGSLAEMNIEWENKYACCIVLASGGYPGNYEKGKEISGLDAAMKLKDIEIFHAGTKINPSIPPLNKGTSSSIPTLNKRGLGGVVTNGGRVLGVTAVADDLKSALDKAYSAVKLIHFDGMHYRTDIGQQSLSTKD